MTALAKTSLRAALIAWTVLAASVPALLVSFPLVGYIRYMTERTAMQELDLKASKVALSLDQEMSSLLATVRSAAGDSDVQRVLSSLLFINRVDRLFLDIVDKQKMVREVRLLNKRGEVVSVAPPARAADPTASGVAEKLAGMVANNERTASSEVLDGDLFLFTPVMGLVGDTAGALVIRVPQAQLLARAKELIPDATVRIFTKDQAEPAASDTLAAAASLRSLYKVRVEEPAEKRLAPIRLLTFRLSAGVVILILLFAMVGWFGTRRLTAPLERLTALVREVSAGKYLTETPAVPFQELQAFSSTLAGLGQAVTNQMRTIREQEKIKGELERAQVQAELDAMRSQMNPHFLFNSLNSVSTMATIDAERAQAMIGRLADLYRGILDASKTATSPLHRELAVVGNYLELEKMRFGDRLRYEIRADSTLEDLHAPGLLIQTLAENAVKHGIGPAREGGSILVVVEAAETGLYKVSVRNTGATFAGRNPAAGGGIGLANTIRRLDLLYGDAHRFHLHKDDTGETVASFYFTGDKK